jgi:hypothetical protein
VPFHIEGRLSFALTMQPWLCCQFFIRLNLLRYFCPARPIFFFNFALTTLQRCVALGMIASPQSPLRFRPARSLWVHRVHPSQLPDAPLLRAWRRVCLARWRKSPPPEVGKLPTHNIGDDHESDSSASSPCDLPKSSKRERLRPEYPDKRRHLTPAGIFSCGPQAGKRSFGPSAPRQLVLQFLRTTDHA